MAYSFGRLNVDEKSGKVLFDDRRLDLKRKPLIMAKLLIRHAPHPIPPSAILNQFAANIDERRASSQASEEALLGILIDRRNDFEGYLKEIRNALRDLKEDPQVDDHLIDFYCKSLKLSHYFGAKLDPDLAKSIPPGEFPDKVESEVEMISFVLGKFIDGQQDVAVEIASDDEFFQTLSEQINALFDNVRDTAEMFSRTTAVLEAISAGAIEDNGSALREVTRLQSLVLGHSASTLPEAHKLAAVLEACYASIPNLLQSIEIDIHPTVVELKIQGSDYLSELLAELTSHALVMSRKRPVIVRVDCSDNIVRLEIRRAALPFEVPDVDRNAPKLGESGIQRLFGLKVAILSRLAKVDVVRDVKQDDPGTYVYRVEVPVALPD